MSTAASPDRTVYRTCPLCEATCGLQIEIRDDRVARIRGDQDDVFSKGFICPKGSSLSDLHVDPDRLRRPVLRDGTDADGAPVFVEVNWDVAFARVQELLERARSAGTSHGIGVYLGNPNVHQLGSNTHNRGFLRALRASAMFSASTVDQMPRHVASGHLYGSPALMPVPDLDRTDLLVILGSNPFVSNGSICTAPGFPDKIDAIRERGGHVVVIDPSYTRTAQAADQHLPIKPGTDAVLLAAIAHRLIATDRVSTGPVAALVDGLAELADRLEPFTASYAASITGIAAGEIDALADQIGDARSAAVHGRIGTTTVEFGTLTTWLIDVIAVLTGNLDREGGSMFPRPATERVRAERKGRAYRIGRFSSRVHGHPEVLGEFPAADLPDEVLEPGDGQLKTLFTLAGNPVLSCPDSERMDDALASLDAMISVDIYINETTRHADVILPPLAALEKSHYDISFYALSVRNIANWSPPVFDVDGLAEDDILARLTLIAMGVGDGDPNVVHDQTVRSLLTAEAAAAGSPVEGRDVDELVSMVTATKGQDRVLDVLVRTGPYGDGFGATPDGLSLEQLRAHPHGIDLGPLEPRLPDMLNTPGSRIDLWAGPFGEELDRLLVQAEVWVHDDRLRLIGRRHLKSNNSWMHNLPILVKGKPRCTLQVHPVDASRLGLTDGGNAKVQSRVGVVNASVEITEIVMPGVVSLPHGWGHSAPGARLGVAAKNAGVNSNVLTDARAIDPLSGTSVLNGIPVDVAPA